MERILSIPNYDSSFDDYNIIRTLFDLYDVEEDLDKKEYYRSLIHNSSAASEYLPSAEDIDNYKNAINNGNLVKVMQGMLPYWRGVGGKTFGYGPDDEKQQVLSDDADRGPLANLIALFRAREAQDIRVVIDKYGRSHLLVGLNCKLEEARDATIYSGHFDTVKPSENNGKLTKVNEGDCEYLSGRGSTDMRHFFATTILPNESAMELTKPIVYCISTDEETVFEGASCLVKALNFCGVIPGQIIVGEPTDNCLKFSNKGSCNLKLNINGVSAHSSQISGISASSVSAYLLKYLDIFNSSHKNFIKNLNNSSINDCQCFVADDKKIIETIKNIINTNRNEIAPDLSSEKIFQILINSCININNQVFSGSPTEKSANGSLMISYKPNTEQENIVIYNYINLISKLVISHLTERNNCKNQLKVDVITTFSVPPFPLNYECVKTISNDNEENLQFPATTEAGIYAKAFPDVPVVILGAGSIGCAHSNQEKTKIINYNIAQVQYYVIAKYGIQSLTPIIDTLIKDKVSSLSPSSINIKDEILIIVNEIDKKIAEKGRFHVRN